MDGISESQSEEIFKTFHFYINDHIASILTRDSNVLKGIDQLIKSLLVRGDQYLANADFTERIAELGGNTAKALSHPLFSQDRLPPQVNKMLPNSSAFILPAEPLATKSQRVVINN